MTSKPAQGLPQETLRLEDEANVTERLLSAVPIYSTTTLRHFGRLSPTQAQCLVLLAQSTTTFPPASHFTSSRRCT